MILLDISETISHFIKEMISKDYRDYLDIHLAKECKTKTGDTVLSFQFDINGQADLAAVQFEVSYRANSIQDTQRLQLLYTVVS